MQQHDQTLACKCVRRWMLMLLTAEKNYSS
jgi:hypothetical protein